jgi:hypothetical protein
MSNFQKFLLLGALILLQFFILAILIKSDDPSHKSLREQGYERVKSVKLVDIHGNIIIIEENGKYSKLWQKSLD